MCMCACVRDFKSKRFDVNSRDIADEDDCRVNIKIMATAAALHAFNGILLSCNQFILGALVFLVLNRLSVWVVGYLGLSK